MKKHLQYVRLVCWIHLNGLPSTVRSLSCVHFAITHGALEKLLLDDCTRWHKTALCVSKKCRLPLPIALTNADFQNILCESKHSVAVSLPYLVKYLSHLWLGASEQVSERMFIWFICLSHPIVLDKEPLSVSLFLLFSVAQVGVYHLEVGF